MVSLCFYFQVHQPFRLQKGYSFFDIGKNHFYEDENANREICNKVSSKCYIPMNHLLLEQIQKHNGKFKVSFSITGVAVEQKADETPVTVADRGAEELLRRLIESRFPGHAVVGEDPARHVLRFGRQDCPPFLIVGAVEPAHGPHPGAEEQIAAGHPDGDRTGLEIPLEQNPAGRVQDVHAAQVARRGDPATVPGEAGEPEAQEEVSFDVRFSTDRTGRTQSFGGYSAEQVLMTVEIVPRSEEVAAEEAEAGPMVLLTELWMSEDFPGYEAVQEAQAEMGREFLESGGSGMADAFQQAFASDPRMQEAFEKNMEEMKELTGIILIQEGLKLVVRDGLKVRNSGSVGCYMV